MLGYWSQRTPKRQKAQVNAIVEYREDDVEFHQELAESDNDDQSDSEEKANGNDDYNDTPAPLPSKDEVSSWSSVMGTINARRCDSLPAPPSSDEESEHKGPQALFRQGSLDSVVSEYKRAFEIYKAAAAHDIPEAHYGLGELYRLGKGVLQDYARRLSITAKLLNWGMHLQGAP